MAQLNTLNGMTGKMPNLISETKKSKYSNVEK